MGRRKTTLPILRALPVTPNGAISEQKLAIMAKRMLANVLSQAEAAGVTVEHIFDYKEIPNG